MKLFFYNVSCCILFTLIYAAYTKSIPIERMIESFPRVRKPARLVPKPIFHIS